MPLARECRYNSPVVELVGLIPAAGRGVRAYPYTEHISKCLLEVDGVALLCRTIEIMRGMGISEVYVVVGHCGERVREFLGDGAALGIRAHVIENDDLDRDLIYSIYLGAKRIEGGCVVVLSDDFYLDSNHSSMLDAPDDAVVTCGLVEWQSVAQAKKNYAVEVEERRVTALVEKPLQVTDRRMGVGTYLLQPAALRALVADVETSAAPSDWTAWIDSLARRGCVIRPFTLTGHYVNINDREALNQANYLARNVDFENRSTSLVFLAESLNGIEESVRHFASAVEISEVVVAAREEGVALQAVRDLPKVRVLSVAEPSTPLGVLLRGALDAATGDILVVAHSADTFAARDLEKLLVYARDADLVVGTRTTRQMIEQGSNMRGVVRVAHLLLATLLELLWWKHECRFTDLCCVYRAIWRTAYESIRGQLQCEGVEILPEMLVEVVRARRRVIEIPVNYYNPSREDRVFHSEHQTLGVFRRILVLLLRRRFAGLAKSNRSDSAANRSHA